MTNDDVLQTIIAQQQYPLLFAVISGSHLYGFSSPDSDYDLRGAHILPLEEIAGLYAPKETFERSDVVDGIELDLVTYDVSKFFHLMLKRNGLVLEQIFSPLIVQTTPEHDELKAIAPGCITKYHAFHYLGFSKKKWDSFKKESPPKVKTLLYVYRVLLAGIYLMQTGDVEANLSNLNETFKLTYIPDLIAQKTSGAEKGGLDNADMSFHEGEFLRLTKMLEDAHETTHLPNNPTAKPELNDLLLRIRGVN